MKIDTCLYTEGKVTVCMVYPLKALAEEQSSGVVKDMVMPLAEAGTDFYFLVTRDK